MNAPLDLSQLQWAGKRPESWKYSDLKRLLSRLPAQLATSTAQTSAPEFTQLDAVRYEWDGQELRSATPDAPQAQRVASRLHQDLADISAELAQAETANWQLDLDDSMQGKTLHLCISHQAGIQRLGLQINIPAQMSVQIIEEHRGGDHGLSVLELNTTLAAGSQVKHTRLQQADSSQILLAQQSVEIGKDAQLHQVLLDWGASASRLRSNIGLVADGAELGLYALAGLRGQQHCDHQVLVRHEAPNARSVLRARGILDESARQIFNGKIYVARGAQKTDSDQLLRNLLLSNKAEVDAKPELEIYADDVRCAHGSTVGRLDETALFYLRSRGLTASHARQLLMLSFAERILTEIPLAAVHDDARAAFAEHLKLDNPA